MTLRKNAGAARRFANLTKFAAGLQAPPNKLAPPPFLLMRISSAYRQSRALYVAARLDIAGVPGDSFATDFDWGRFERVIDVGGSRGANSIAILKRHPRLTTLVMDRPGVIEAGARHWRGRERTQAQWRALTGRGGMELEEAVGLRSLASLIVPRGRQ